MAPELEGATCGPAIGPTAVGRLARGEIIEEPGGCVTLELDRALARQSYDKLAAELARRWKSAAPDKPRSARSLAAEIRKLAAGNATWFQRRPEAARALARLLRSTPAKLGLVLFEVQALHPLPGGWNTHDTRATLEAAEDLAWSLLTRHGGQWRVRHGDQTVASGVGYRPGEHQLSHDRTAILSRVRDGASAKKRRDV